MSLLNTPFLRFVQISFFQMIMGGGILCLSACDDQSSPLSDAFIPTTMQGGMTQGDIQRERIDQGIDLNMSVYDQGVDQGQVDYLIDKWELLDATVPPPACESVERVPSPQVNLEQKKFALSLFHYNVEYVIGGLMYVDDEGNEKYILHIIN